MKRQTLLRILLVFGILVLVNVIAVKVFTRFDMTSNQAYTLSSTSKDLVGSLEDKFLVKAYFSGDLPSPYNNHRRILQDALDEYRAYSDGNFQYEFIDPAENKEIETEAQRYGIPPVQVQVVKEDKMQVQNAFMGLVFLYGDKHEQIPVVQNLNNLEYDISSTMKKMLAKDLKQIGFLTGHGEPGLDAVKALTQQLQKQYTVTTVDLTGGQPVPASISVLVIGSPTTPFKDWEKYLIDQYLMKGGRVAFLLNKVTISPQTGRGIPNETGLDDLMQAYGVRVNTDLVRDVRCASVAIPQEVAPGFVMQVQRQFPYLPIGSDFNPTSPVVKDLAGVVFYFGSSIDTSGAQAKGLKTDVLVRSSKQSGRQEGVFIVSPDQPMTEEMFKESGIPLAVSVEGNFQSAYASRQPAVDSGMAPVDGGQKLAQGSSKIVVVGDGEFLQDQVSRNGSNLVFASNLIDYLADDIGLAAIRSRETAPKPLDEVSDATRSLVKGTNLFLPPVLIVLAGIFRWRWRAAMRKRLENRQI